MAVDTVYVPSHFFTASGRTLLAYGSPRSAKPLWVTQYYLGSAMGTITPVMDAGPLPCSPG